MILKLQFPIMNTSATIDSGGDMSLPMPHTLNYCESWMEGEGRETIV